MTITYKLRNYDNDSNFTDYGGYNRGSGEEGGLINFNLLRTLGIGTPIGSFGLERGVGLGIGH